MMQHILITNLQLTIPGGTVSYVKDLSLFLVNKGFGVEVFTYKIGVVGEEMIEEGIHVVTQLSDLKNRPDIIHAHHYPTAFEALNYFKDVPAIYFIHNKTSRFDTPLYHPNIICHAAVDYNCLDRYHDYPVSNQLTQKVIYNWVDTNRFKLKESSNKIPARAVVFSNYATRDNHYQIIVEACRQLNLPLDTIGAGMGNSLSHPEAVLANYDIVFAKAKAAMESLAIGNAVVLCDFAGVGGMVQYADIDYLRKFNFGRKVLIHSYTVEKLIEEIKKYNVDDINQTTKWIRENVSLEVIGKQLIDCYTQLIDEFNNRKKSSSDISKIVFAHAYYLKGYYFFTQTHLFKFLSGVKYFIKNKLGIN